MTFSSVSQSYLPGLESNFGRVFAISSATLVRRAVDCDLPLSVLLQGARGAGKFTVASWVAQCLGMHLLEVVLISRREALPDNYLGQLL